MDPGAALMGRRPGVAFSFSFSFAVAGVIVGARLPDQLTSR